MSEELVTLEWTEPHLWAQQLSPDDVRAIADTGRKPPLGERCSDAQTDAARAWVAENDRAADGPPEPAIKRGPWTCSKCHQPVSATGHLCIPQAKAQTFEDTVSDRFEPAADGPPEDAPTPAMTDGDVARILGSIKWRLKKSGEPWTFNALDDAALDRAIRVLLGEPVVEPVTPECRHEESLYGRCTRCGMTWEQQAAARVEPVTPPEQRLDEQVEAELIRLDDAGQVGTAAVIRALTAELRAERKSAPVPSVLVDRQGREWVPTLPADVVVGDVVPHAYKELPVTEIQHDYRGFRFFTDEGNIFRESYETLPVLREVAR